MSERDEFEALRRLVAAVARVDASFDDAGSVLSDALEEQAAALDHARAVIAARATQAVPSLTPKAIKEMAWEAHNLAARIPGATPYNAAVFALEAVRDLLDAPQPSPEPEEPAHAHDWRFSLQDHLYKCECGATRGDYPFGAASFKD